VESSHQNKESELLREYHTALSEYGVAVKKLIDLRWSKPPAVYLQMHQDAEKLRLKAEGLRLAGDIHGAEAKDS
jgi:hypothetical protein